MSCLQDNKTANTAALKAADSDEDSEATRRSEQEEEASDGEPEYSTTAYAPQ